ncbi:hypothetical protein AUQ37_05205 [Candidatus Methanomethylophilus sp. 1R26]|jgi:ferredoxin|uniref:EFR1 family ferrodoxin n=1 Tax=Candidatus Methanomethylophilus sp. 1R26 TaxID=1769296 RepID=UPI00073732B9|nr:EFR1 family ferrodoxin [Candidatus Methanomethylophilus sp. 1R26]MCI2074167.1 EFR1 family ferrodoxin [Methanomethylophilus sp.]TQS79004.1 MAG: hypothetical protein A3Q59_01490 [Methanomethylophilus alvi]WII09346.1 EFR1 family ferrodoxin [Methanomassiliicoccales archaeon LGM-DZ1]KUE74287.1 hypothetical protein AUQ37_05205 [Candidatus Methanomethylophilus sp. 1R26]MCI2093036.1 EFR1 family ferrodoxin [Methanomethylophilus sp.]
MKIFYFTGTGNSLAIARKMQRKGDELISIPHSLRSGATHYKDDVIGIVSPVYAGSAPKMVQDFLKRTELEAGYRWIVFTYGMVPGNPLWYLDPVTEAQGWKFDFEGCIEMPNSYLPLAKIPKETSKECLRWQDDSAWYLRNCVDHRMKLRWSGYPENTAYTSAMRGMWAKIVNSHLNESFTVTDACVGCGICAKACPGHAIEIVDGKPVWQPRCEGCYGCINHCPHQAIVSKKVKRPDRYINKDVTAADIVAANE